MKKTALITLIAVLAICAALVALANAVENNFRGKEDGDRLPRWSKTRFEKEIRNGN